MTRIALEHAAGVRRAILLTVVFGVPLLFLKGFTYDRFNVPKLALLIAGTSVAAGILIGETMFGRRTDRLRLLLVPAAALTLPLAVAWLFSPYHEWALFGQYPRFQGLIPYVVFALFGLLLADAFVGRPLPLAWALSAAGAVVGAYTVLQMLGLDPIAWEEVGNASTIGHTNFSGAYMAIALPPSIYLWVHARRRQRWAMATTILIGTGLLLANSQGAWAAGLAGLAITVGSLSRRRQTTSRAVGIGIAGVVAVMLVGTVALSSVLPVAKVQWTAGTRAHFWGSALGMTADSPWIGRGPNVYAVEGVQYRSLPSALNEGYIVADDPHSVFFSYLANAGIVGAAGYLIALAWVLHAGIRSSTNTLQRVFFASAMAYFVQSLVSIDEPTSRVGLWTALAGIAASRTRAGAHAAEVHAPVQIPRWRSIVAVALTTSVAVAGVSWSTQFVLADHRIELGMDAFEGGRVAAARKDFALARSFRDEYEYRELYARQLGIAGLNRGEDGTELIAEMHSVNRYLQSFPETTGIMVTAQTLHYWGRFDPRAELQALALYKRGLSLDPYNPLIHSERAEVLMDLGRSEEAVHALESTSLAFAESAPEFWATLAIARLEVGDEKGARQALATATRLDPHGCRTLMADELFEVMELGGTVAPSHSNSVALAFNCGPGLYDFFLDRLPAVIRAQYT